jgi:hypothetical protein
VYSYFVFQRIIVRGIRGRDRMVVGFITTYAIRAYHHSSCGFESRSGEVRNMNTQVINTIWLHLFLLFLSREKDAFADCLNRNLAELGTNSYLPYGLLANNFDRDVLKNRLSAMCTTLPSKWLNIYLSLRLR